MFLRVVEAISFRAKKRNAVEIQYAIVFYNLKPYGLNNDNFCNCLARRALGVVEHGNKQHIYRGAVTAVSPTAKSALREMPFLQHPIAYGE